MKTSGCCVNIGYPKRGIDYSQHGLYYPVLPFLCNFKKLISGNSVSVENSITTLTFTVFNANEVILALSDYCSKSTENLRILERRSGAY